MDFDGKTNDDLLDFVDELRKRKNKGDNVVDPGISGNAVPTSASTKSVGVDALVAGEGGNFATFTGWEDPSRKMDPRVRRAMLFKSLSDVGYQYQGHWDDLGSFIKEGWSNHKSGDFMDKHKTSFSNISSDFFKARGMSGLSGEDGGYLINPEIAPTIEWLFNDNDLSSRIDVRNTSQVYFKWPRAKDLNRNDGTRHGGITSAWIDEGDPGDESRPKMTFTDLKQKKLAVFVFMTHEIANDTPYAVEQYVKTAVREEINFAINRAIMWGKGGVEPLGFANTGATVEVPKHGTQAADTFTYDNVLRMRSQMYRTSNSKAVWLHHQTVIPEIGKLSVNGHPVALDYRTGAAENEVIGRLLGRDVIESELCAPLGDPGDVWYCDLKQYKAIAQSMVREDISTHVEFMSDQNCLRFIFRFDGSPLFPDAITPYKSPDATVDPPKQGSFLKLAARA